MVSSASGGNGLPKYGREKHGTLGNHADTDGDGREDLLDFVAIRPGAPAPIGSRTRPSSPTEKEERVIDMSGLPRRRLLAQRR